MMEWFFGRPALSRTGYAGRVRRRFAPSLTRPAARNHAVHAIDGVVTIMATAEEQLPAGLLQGSSLRGGEYAWPIEDIPKVIEAARLENLASVGGQLQFRIPDGGTCECYWIEIDPTAGLSPDLPWAERVSLTAERSLAAFQNLRSQFDFIEEGRKAFASHLDKYEAEGGDLNQVMCFVWYLENGPN